MVDRLILNLNTMPKIKSPKPIERVKLPEKLTTEEAKGLINILKERFEQNRERHQDIEWSVVERRLTDTPDKLNSLNAMEVTGGEPDVVRYDEQADAYLFFDCSPETPERHSICYDQAGEDERTKKGIYPGGNAIELAKQMGIEVLDEEKYRYLQSLGEFDTKTSSWLKTPDSIRKLGGAIFGDRRYGHVFIYHNGAQSFYSGRGFRGVLSV